MGNASNQGAAMKFVIVFQQSWLGSHFVKYGDVGAIKRQDVSGMAQMISGFVDCHQTNYRQGQQGVAKYLSAFNSEVFNARNGRKGFSKGKWFLLKVLGHNFFLYFASSTACWAHSSFWLCNGFCDHAPIIL